MGAMPIAALVTPTSADPIPDLVENILAFPQYVSVSYWLGWSAERVTGTNPWQWVGDQYGGDWSAVQRAGGAIRKLAEFNDAYAGVLNSAVDTVGHDWQGRAAASANEYITGLVTILQEQIPELAALGKEFEQLAIGMYEWANAIKGLMEILTDLLIAVGLAAAAAAATGWTLIGPLPSGAAAAATITKAVGVWEQILETHDHVWNAVQGFTGLVAGYLGGLDGLAAVPLPAGAYDHPGA